MSDDKKIQEVYAVEYTITSDDFLLQNQLETSPVGKNYSDDPEVAAMTRDELTQSILSLAGKWANRDDINDDWLDNVRASWDTRLNDVI